MIQILTKKVIVLKIVTTPLSSPYIVLCGFYNCGKSYSASLIKNDLDIAVNINKYDFITRLLMYFFEINPISTDYN